MQALLNWLVEGTALTFAVALGVRLHRTMTAATRERLWWITMISVALMPIAYVVADVGLAMGNSSRQAALKTAGFFSRVGNSFGNGSWEQRCGPCFVLSRSP